MIGQVGGNRLQVSGEPIDDPRVGEHRTGMPRTGPRGQEIKTRQVILNPIHRHTHAALVGEIHHVPQILECLRANQGAVGLDVRPNGKHPHVIQTNSREHIKIGGDLVGIEI